ncbi:MAG TPA: MogA/MoaB family molybdenum cofactor biosynthesis protein [Candidatus Omnitrophota bacterium]|nr:MogA/MoaB family molybdenum cofactor biosynthesis protein [Candidatus Omnitrophota bacterium]
MYSEQGERNPPAEGSSDQTRGKRAEQARGYRAAVLTISDKCSTGQREDRSGKIVQELIRGLPAEVVKYDVIPDEPDMIKERLIDYCDNLKVDLVLTNGGTGFTVRDFTPEATREVIEKEAPGIPEAMRVTCLKSTKRAMLSRAIAGIRNKTLIVNLPGSSQGAKESLEAILETLPHGLDMILGKEH